MLSDLPPDSLVDDAQGVLYSLLARLHVPKLYQFIELARADRIEREVQPGAARLCEVGPALSVALDGRQLRARSGRPPHWSFLLHACSDTLVFV